MVLSIVFPIGTLSCPLHSTEAWSFTLEAPFSFAPAGGMCHGQNRRLEVGEQGAEHWWKELIATIF